MGAYGAVMDEEAAEFLADAAGGDARAALNAVELGVLTTEREQRTERSTSTWRWPRSASRSGRCGTTRTGDNHYDTISAFIKSMRGSDPDAAVYYLARMLYAGEDIKFIARRIMICASEDVGNADPAGSDGGGQRRPRRWSGWECRRRRLFCPRRRPTWPRAPKSNAACMAIDAAMEAVRRPSRPPCLSHLQDAPLQRCGRSWDGGRATSTPTITPTTM